MNRRTKITVWITVAICLLGFAWLLSYNRDGGYTKPIVDPRPKPPKHGPPESGYEYVPGKGYVRTEPNNY